MARIQVRSSGGTSPYRLLVASNGDRFVWWKSTTTIHIDKVASDGTISLDVGSATITDIFGGTPSSTMWLLDACIDSTNKIHWIVTHWLGSTPTRRIAYNYFNTSNNTWGLGTWELAATSNPTVYCGWPKIRIDENDKPHIAFSEFTGKMDPYTPFLYYSNRISGSWSTREQVYTSPYSSVTGFDVGASGEVYLATSSQIGSDLVGRYRIRTAGSWGVDTQIPYTAPDEWLGAVIVTGDGTRRQYGVGAPNIPYYWYMIYDGSRMTSYYFEASYGGYCYSPIKGTSADAVLFWSFDDDSVGISHIATKNSGVWTDHGQVQIDLNESYADIFWQRYAFHGLNSVANYVTWARLAATAYYLDTYDMRAVVRSHGHGYLKGNIFVKSNKSAYLLSKDQFKHAYMVGNPPGTGSIKFAYLRGDALRSHKSAYMLAETGVRIAVVNFTTRTDTGTQDITDAALNGLPVRLAIFFGAGGVTSGTARVDMREFFGATDGTRQWLTAMYTPDGGSSNDGYYNTSYCCGMALSSGGVAAFDSFITNGVRINWTNASNQAWLSCCMLFASFDPNELQAYVGQFQQSSAIAGNDYDVTALGFEPDLVIYRAMHSSYIGNSNFGYAFVKPDTGEMINFCNEIDFDTGAYNWPGGGGGNTYNGYPCVCDYYTSNYKWSITQMLSNGFRMHCIDAGTELGYYVALRFAPPWYVKDVYVEWPYGAGSKTFTSGLNTKAIYAHCSHGWGWWTPGQMGMLESAMSIGAADASHQQAGTWRYVTIGGSPMDTESNVRTDRIVYCSDPNGSPIIFEGQLTSLTQNGFVINQTTTYLGATLFLCFGTCETAKSSKHVFLLAHQKHVPAYLRGEGRPKSNKPVFLVSGFAALANRNSFIQGSLPTSSNKSAYTNCSSIPTSNRHAYLIGQVKDNHPAYLDGLLRSHIPAIVVASTPAISSAHAYLWDEGIERSIAHAFIGVNAMDYDWKHVYLKGKNLLRANQPVYLLAVPLLTDSCPGYLSGKLPPARSIRHAYLRGLSRQSKHAYMEGFEMEYDYIILATEDRSTRVKRFKVVAEGYDDGSYEKAGTAERTIGGGIDVMQGAVYPTWSPTIRVWTIVTDSDYGTLNDLFYFFSLNNPRGNPSSRLWFTDHHGVERKVSILGTFKKSLLGSKVEGSTASYFVNLTLTGLEGINQ